MKKAYALLITEKNIEGIKHYGYGDYVPELSLMSSYLVLGSGGSYIINAGYFDETFAFVMGNGESTTIELTNLLDFGANTDERTLKPFVPKNSDVMYWDSFVIQLFYDKKHDFSGILKTVTEITVPKR